MKQQKNQLVPLRLASDIGKDKHDNSRRKLSKTHLINALNRIHFGDGEINLWFKHNKFNSSLSLPVKPQACKDDILCCNWVDSAPCQEKIKCYTFDSLTFADGLNQVQVPAELLEINGSCIQLELPNHSHETLKRKIRRFDSIGISAQIIQDGLVINGNLINFTAQSLMVAFHYESSLLQNEIDNSENFHLVLKKDDDFIFSGLCSLIRQEKAADQKLLVLKPLVKKVHRYKAKEFRSERVTLNPLPTLIFQHPLINKKIQLDVMDISGMGFSVEESSTNSVLLPGMIIPNLEISFMQSNSIHCKCQVLYRTTKDDAVRCGLVILDMKMADYLKLSSLLHQVRNKHSYINSDHIDFNALWDFFFKSGFIYPEKYHSIVDHKETLEDTFRRVYKGHPEIAHYITFQDKGEIFGHISIHRYYQKTWLLHHLAAIKSTKHKAGLIVLEHIFKHINELHSLPSAKMNYLAGYFRPENRFSSRLFGPKTVNTINDLNKCSVDEFAYLHYEPHELNPLSPVSSWKLTETDCEDMIFLNLWYNENSGGLTIKALDLAQDSLCKDHEINQEYFNAGFKRDRKLFSLKKDNELVAVLVVNISDFGLNMSDLTNCIQVFAIDEDQLDKDTLLTYLHQLTDLFVSSKVPIMIFPKTFADTAGISYEKTYMLGILNLEFIDDYLEFKHSLIYPKRKIPIRQIR